MSLTSLMREVGVSAESIDPIVPVAPVVETPLVPEAVVSPVDQPSGAVPVADVIVSTEPSSVAPLVDMVPTTVVDTAVAEAVEITQIEATAQQLESEQCAVKTKADELLEIQTSLESMDQLVRKAGANGISNQTAEMVQLQLKSINRKLGIESIFVSIESFSAKDLRGQHDQARIALESIRTSIKVTKNKFFAIIEKIIALFKRIAMNYLDGVNAMEKKVDALDKRLGSLKKPTAKGTLAISNPGLVLFDDSLDIPADIPGLAHFAASAYPEAVVKFFDGITKGILKFDPEEANLDEVEAFFEQYSKPLKFLIEQKVADDALPGGYHLDVSEGGMSVGIKGELKQADTKEVDVQPVVELRKKVRDIKQIVTQMKAIRPEVDKIDKAGKKLTEAAKRVIERKGGEASSETIESMQTRVATLVQQATPRVGEIIGYLGRYLNAQLAVCTAMTEEIESGKMNSTETENSVDDTTESKSLNNIDKFVSQNKPVTYVRSALTLALHSKDTTYDSLMNKVREIGKKYRDLFEPYTVKQFAREINETEADWTKEYFDKQEVYLESNFSKERYYHLADVAHHLGWLT